MKAPSTPIISDIVQEFEGVTLGDLRLNRRVATIAKRLNSNPEASFPALMQTQAEIEAFYRFLRNDKTSLEKLLEPHADATQKRANEWGLVVVAHDSTEVAFKGDGRDGLYKLRAGTCGFGVHLSLAIGFGEQPHPLGVLAVSVHPDSKSDRDRWLRQAQEVDSRFQDRSKLIHVMDREADVYSLFVGLSSTSSRFIVRARHDRILTDDAEQERTLLEQLEHRTEVLAYRSVHVSERRARAKTSMPDERKAHPPRRARIAQLAIRACTVTIPRPQRQPQSLPDRLQINIVQVYEIDPPAGEEPIDWLLATNESIDTAEDVIRIVDIYRVRWFIEEYFKALKTGCAYESRQLEQMETLEVALGFFIPIAWQLLLIRSCSRMTDISAKVVMSESRLQILMVLCDHKKHIVSSTPTARDVMLAVARLGGHLKQNGDPGWQVLWRGFKKVIEAEEIFMAIQNCR